jgi:hypothetical protein
MGALAKLIGYAVIGVFALPVLASIYHTQNPSEPAHSIVQQSAPRPIETAPIIESTPDAQPNRSPGISIGQSFSIGYWVYRINASTWTNVLGDGFALERANAAFLVVDVTAQNNDRTASILPPFHLRDSDGREYDETSAGALTSGFFNLLEKLNPGVSKRADIAFDVPPNREYVLLASGGFESRENVVVSLTAPAPPPEAKRPEPIQSSAPRQIQPTPQPQSPPPAVQPDNSAPVLTTPRSVERSNPPTSGVLCNGPINVPQNGTMVFKDLPADRLHFTFDHDAWQPTIQLQPDGRKTLIMRSLNPGIQTYCHVRWEIVQ